jgi:AcrR family transcriptional regulator
MKRRTYQLKLRAERQRRTRQRIVEAAVALHEQLGPRHTTISALAERAGVQRLTVYRHFPDDQALFAACSAHWFGLNPPPDAQAWRDLADPAARSRAALGALYAYFRRTARMWRSVYRDLEALPALEKPMAQAKAYMEDVAGDLLAAWRPGPGARRTLKAALGHCVAFATWESLAREGLRDAEMADAAVRWLEALANQRAAAGRVRAIMPA